MNALVATVVAQRIDRADARQIVEPRSACDADSRR